MSGSIERRENPGWTVEEKQRLLNHLALEEAREKSDHEKFERGEARMDKIEQDLRPLNKMFWAVIGSAGVGVALLATVLWIYNNDREQASQMQHVLYEQGAAIKMLLQSHAELERDYRRDIQRLEAERR